MLVQGAYLTSDASSMGSGAAAWFIKSNRGHKETQELIYRVSIEEGMDLGSKGVSRFSDGDDRSTPVIRACMRRIQRLITEVPAAGSWLHKTFLWHRQSWWQDRTRGSECRATATVPVSTRQEGP